MVYLCSVLKHKSKLSTPQKTIDKLLHQLYQLLNPPASASTKRQKNPMESSSSSSRCAALRAWWEETTDTRLLSSPWICRPAGTSLRVAMMFCNILVWSIRVTWQMDPWFFGQGVKKKESRSQGREKDNKELGEKKQVDQSWTDCFEVNELKKIFVWPAPPKKKNVHEKHHETIRYQG